MPSDAPSINRHRVCGHKDPSSMHECGRDSEHTDAHRCPCGEAWWQ